MDMLQIFQEITEVTFYSAELEALIESLPLEARNLFLKNDFQALRKLISNSENFPDSKTVSKEIPVFVNL